MIVLVVSNAALLDSRRTVSPSINFGKVEVLEEHSRPLLIHNPTPIPADFKLFIEGRDSSFSIEPRDLRLAPGETSEAVIHASLDETQTFKDELHVLIEEGADVPVPLEATGVGNTLVSEELSGDQLDFTHQFVGRPFSKEITVHNMGRKTVTLSLNNVKVEEVKKAFAKGEGSI